MNVEFFLAAALAVSPGVEDAEADADARIERVKVQLEELRVKRHVFHARMPKLGTVGTLALLAGAAGVGVLYAQALSPEVMSFDVRWYHVPLAQR